MIYLSVTFTATKFNKLIEYIIIIYDENIIMIKVNSFNKIILLMKRFYNPTPDLNITLVC